MIPINSGGIAVQLREGSIALKEQGPLGYFKGSVSQAGIGERATGSSAVVATSPGTSG